MLTRLNPYLGFTDNARQAMEFYTSVFGGKLVVNTFAESGMGGDDPAEGKKVMHAQLDTENGMVLMSSDTPAGMERQSGSSVSLSLSGDNDEELSGYFKKLADGGKVTMPLEKAPWGDKFGMLTDKFGMNWMVNISPEKPAADAPAATGDPA